VLELGRSSLCEVVVAGAITVGRAGERLAPLAEMAQMGVRIFTDDGAGVQDGRLMRRALEYALPLGVTLAQHCEDAALAAGSVMNMITPSGTNQFHGSVWEYLRNGQALDARNFFAVNQTNPLTGQEIPGSALPEYIRNQFGFAVGGPASWCTG